MKVKELILNTTSLQRQKEFYATVLELPIVAESDNTVSFRCGNSELTFIQAENKNHPYHFAFNIPSFQELDALNWLKKRLKIIPFEGEDIIDFKGWNAKAIYFYDTDNNIVEFIARRNLNIPNDKSFGPDSLKCVSEIGMATTDIENLYRQLNHINPLPVFDGTFQKFCAAGNEEGLFILVNKNEKQWFPTGDRIYISDLILKGDYNIEYKNGSIITL